MNKEKIPNNNLPIYLQEYTVDILDDSENKKAGSVQYTTVGAISSNEKGKRVWQLNLTGYLEPNVQKYNIVYDFSNVNYKEKNIRFENIISGTFNICGQVLDAFKIIGFDYSYSDPESTLTIKLDTSKWNFRIKKKIEFSYCINVDDQTCLSLPYNEYIFIPTGEAENIVCPSILTNENANVSFNVSSISNTTSSTITMSVSDDSDISENVTIAPGETGTITISGLEAYTENTVYSETFTFEQKIQIDPLKMTFTDYNTIIPMTINSDSESEISFGGYNYTIDSVGYSTQIDASGTLISLKTLVKVSTVDSSSVNCGITGTIFRSVNQYIPIEDNSLENIYWTQTYWDMDSTCENQNYYLNYLNFDNVNNSVTVQWNKLSN